MTDWHEALASTAFWPAPVQIGPAYHCFTCGAPARGLVHWLPCHSDLDAWAVHIAYLELPCGCSGRVARLGEAITPLTFFTDLDIRDFHARVSANLEAVARAVRYLAAAARLAAGETGTLARATPEGMANWRPSPW